MLIHVDQIYHGPMVLWLCHIASQSRRALQHLCASDRREESPAETSLPCHARQAQGVKGTLALEYHIYVHHATNAT